MRSSSTYHQGRVGGSLFLMLKNQYWKIEPKYSWVFVRFLLQFGDNKGHPLLLLLPFRSCFLSPRALQSKLFSFKLSPWIQIALPGSSCVFPALRRLLPGKCFVSVSFWLEERCTYVASSIFVFLLWLVNLSFSATP